MERVILRNGVEVEVTEREAALMISIGAAKPIEVRNVGPETENCSE